MDSALHFLCSELLVFRVGFNGKDTEDLTVFLSSKSYLSQEVLEVIKTYEISGFGTVTLKANNKSIDQRPKLEKEINKKKRQYENIAIFSIADRFNSSLGS